MWSERGKKIGKEKNGRREEGRERGRRVIDDCSAVRVETLPSPVSGPHSAAVW